MAGILKKIFTSNSPLRWLTWGLDLCLFLSLDQTKKLNQTHWNYLTIVYCVDQCSTYFIKKKKKKPKTCTHASTHTHTHTHTHIKTCVDQGLSTKSFVLHNISVTKAYNLGIVRFNLKTCVDWWLAYMRTHTQTLIDTQKRHRTLKILEFWYLTCRPV